MLISLLNQFFEMPPTVLGRPWTSVASLIKALSTGELQGIDTILLGLLDENPTTRMTLATTITRLKDIVAKVPDADAKMEACYRVLE
jgi:hypothetical protein